LVSYAKRTFLYDQFYIIDIDKIKGQETCTKNKAQETMKKVG